MRFYQFGALSASVIGVYAAASQSIASVIAPPLNLQVICSKGTWSSDPAATQTGTSQFEYVVDKTSTVGQWTAHYDVKADTDPFVSDSFSITNTASTTQIFTSIVSLPISAISPATLTGGSVSGSVTDSNGNGATLTNVGTSSIYTALIDGSAYKTLLDNPTSITAGTFLSSPVGPASFGTPIPSLTGPAIASSIGVEFTFTLSPGDSASFTGVFDVQPVPEPGMLSIAGIAGLALLRRRRR